jgi:HlyD family secretion protein
MNKKLPISIIIGVLIIISFGAIHLKVQREMSEMVNNENYVYPEIRKIVKTESFSGSIVPYDEVDINSHLSGVLVKNYCMVGDKIREGDSIAKVNVKISPFQYLDLKNEVQLAKANYESSRLNYEKNTILFKKKIISQEDYDLSIKQLKDAKLVMDNNINKLAIIDNNKAANNSENIITSPISGTVIEFPANEGETIVGSGEVNEGTIIAKVADMDSLYFRGVLTDKEVFKIKKGDVLKVKLAAIPDQIFEATVVVITSKSTVVDDGNPRYEILAALKLPKQYKNTIFEGFNAVADLILDEKKCLCIEEDFVFFRNDSTFVSVFNEEGKSELRPVTLGISDGFYSEIISGVTREDKIKKTDIQDDQK